MLRAKALTFYWRSCSISAYAAVSWECSLALPQQPAKRPVGSLDHRLKQAVDVETVEMGMDRNDVVVIFAISSQVTSTLW